MQMQMQEWQKIVEKHQQHSSPTERQDALDAIIQHLLADDFLEQPPVIRANLVNALQKNQALYRDLCRLIELEEIK